MTQLRKLQMAIFNERVSSLEEDGYVVQIRTVTAIDNVWFATMRHRSNGNRIVIKAYPLENRIVQFTNKICTHTDTMVKQTASCV